MTDFTGGTWRSLVDGSEVSIIPDSEVYLQDDWGDNKLTDRDDSGTTTHNGVEGVYRPEWSIDAGDPTVDDGQLLIEANEELVAISTDINVNLDEPTTFEWFDVDASEGRAGNSANIGMTCFAETNNHISRGTGVGDPGQAGLENGYAVVILDAGFRLKFGKIFDDGLNTLIDVDGFSPPYNIRVERSSNSEWELFVDDDSQGTTTDSEFDDPQFTGYTPMDDDDVVLRVDEMKVS